MKKFVILFFLVLFLLPSVALAEGEDDILDFSDPTPTPESTLEPTEMPENTPEPIETPESILMPMELLESTSEPTATPYYYVLDDSTIIGGLAAFMGVQDGENTPQNLGEAIPYLLRIALTVGVLWFVYAMIRGFTGNVFGKARKGGQ